ncbi:valyl-tRNA synthetase, partial [Piptocephalis cylindrospora]
MSEPQKPTSLAKNIDKNEAKKRAKLEKLAAKQAKLAAVAAAKEAKGGEVGESKKAKVVEAKPIKETKAFVNTTPAGEKKDLSEPLAAAYDPQAVEASWYEWWVKEGIFKAQLSKDAEGKNVINPKGKFVIPIPPPNITGALHIGHALTVAIQDTLIRWNRMLGKSVLYNPGCDHAGIATQVVVEKRLWKEQGKTRHDMGRDAFTAEVWKWRESFGDRIYGQLRRLGGSYDWSRVRFTMDPALSKSVTEAFVRLHQEGVIYRASRLVNWSTALNTAISNLEVENKELSGRTTLTIPGYEKKVEFGVITSFAYPIEGSDEKIVVATTRPETMLGDTGIAVHPTDERYKHLHGRFATHPFIPERRIPIICDDIAVDMAFGTGAVKMTPAHDPNDFEVGKRHDLEFINILNDDGTMNQNAGPFAGMKRFDVRYAVVDALKEKGLFVDVADNPMSVPICTKSGDVIEPLIKPQWWVKCQDMAKDAMLAVQEGRLEIQPKLSEREWFRWLGNIQDWCISRQLWWGHRVPAYFVSLEGRDQKVGDRNDDHYWVSGR